MDEVQIARQYGNLDAHKGHPTTAKRLLKAFLTEEERVKLHQEKMDEMKNLREEHFKELQKFNEDIDNIKFWGGIGDGLTEIAKQVVDYYLNPKKKQNKDRNFGVNIQKS